MPMMMKTIKTMMIKTMMMLVKLPFVFCGEVSEVRRWRLTETRRAEKRPKRGELTGDWTTTVGVGVSESEGLGRQHGGLASRLGASAWGFGCESWCFLSWGLTETLGVSLRGGLTETLGVFLSEAWGFLHGAFWGLTAKRAF